MERIMNVADVSLSMNLRLNKADSQDYNNLWRYHKENAFNKAVSDWLRRQVRGKNQTQEGDEESTGRVDDLQPLLKSDSLSVRDKGIYAESSKLPSDYRYHKRVTPLVTKGNCSSIRISSHLREEGNVDELLPTISFAFEDTFHTLATNKIRAYHNKEFTVEKIDLVYYRNPKSYDFSKLDDLIEFKDDVTEILIDEAVKIASSDIESFNAKNVAQERTEFNT